MARETEYLNLEIAFHSLAEGGVEVQVRSPDQRSARSTFQLPTERREDIEQLVANLEEHVLRDVDADRPEPPDPLDVSDLGSQLFTGLFADDVAEILIENLARVDHLDPEGPARGLRLWLRFDEDLADLASLPWTLLYRLTKREFLGRNPLTPVSQCIVGPRPTTPLKVQAPLRVLIIIPKPINSAPFDDHGIADRIRQELRRTRQVEIDVVQPPTLDQLIDTLDKDSNFHILHFMGHGGFSEEGGFGGLFFEDRRGQKDVVAGRVLGEHLMGYKKSLRVAVLSSCKTAKMQRQRGQDPFSGVATALAFAGFPAVVAMQFTVSVRAAVKFSGKFYSALASGDPVDVATTKGRLAIYRELPNSLEWLTPTLFMQVPDGNLQIEGKMPVKLGIRSFVGYDAGMEERVHHYKDFLSDFDGRQIRDQADWRSRIYPGLADFLKREAPEGQPIHLEIPAHCSIAFAAGYYLQAKGGYDVSVRQRTLGRTESWRAEDGSSPPVNVWSDLKPTRIRWFGKDLAVAVSVTKATEEDASLYVKKAGLPVSHLVSASLFGGHGQTSIRNGAHAFDLAQNLVAFLEDWERRNTGTIHLFAAAPNAFMLFLGQLSRGLRNVQLYEYDFDSKKPGAYSPSFRFPPRSGSA